MTASIRAARIRIELPLPPREASPNYKGSRLRRAEAVARYRRDCFLAYRAAKVPALPTPVVVHLDYYLERPASLAARYRAANDWQPMDADNGRGAAKPAQDALQDAGVVPSDRAAFVKLGHCEFHSQAPEGVSPRCLVLTLEYLEPEGGAR